MAPCSLPPKHGGGHCAAAQLDPHGACGHSSVLAGFAGLLYFADIYFADIYFADIYSDIFLPLILFPADISFKYQIFADIFILSGSRHIPHGAM